VGGRQTDRQKRKKIEFEGDNNRKKAETPKER
jgi:hypothetical protein